MKREEKEEKITDLNFPETKINNILKISIYYKKNVCGHLFLCKELKSLMFWVVEGKGSESGFSSHFQVWQIVAHFFFLSLITISYLDKNPTVDNDHSYLCLHEQDNRN